MSLNCDRGEAAPGARTLRLFVGEDPRPPLGIGAHPGGGHPETGLLWLEIHGKLHKVRFWTTRDWSRLAAHDRPPGAMAGEHGGYWAVEPWVTRSRSGAPSAAPALRPREDWPA
jgi:hypothetical protein